MCAAAALAIEPVTDATTTLLKLLEVAVSPAGVKEARQAHADDKKAVDSGRKSVVELIIKRANTLVNVYLKKAFAEGKIERSNHHDPSLSPGRMAILSFTDFAAEVDEVLTGFIHYFLNQSNPSHLMKFIDEVLMVTLDCPDAKLRSLFTAFNSLDDSDTRKPSVFGRIITFSSQTGLYEVAVHPCVSQNATKWIRRWPKGGDELFFQLADVVASTHVDLCEEWMYEGIKLSSNADVSRVTRVVQSLLTKPSFFDFANVLGLPIVDKLKTEPTFGPIYELVALIHEGKSIAALEEAWKAAERHVIQQSSSYKTLTIEHIRSKGTTIMVSRLSAEAISSMSGVYFEKKLSFEEIGSELHLTLDQVEEACANAITFKLLTGRIDQVNGTLILGSGTHKDFGPTQWEETLGRLYQWKAAIHSVFV